MDRCRLSVAATGAFLHPLGDQTPIDCRHSEWIDSIALPHRELLSVDTTTPVPYGSLVNPRAVVVWNLAGVGLQVQPTPEEAAAIAARVLEIGLTDQDLTAPTGWLQLPAALPGKPQGGSQLLWLAPGTRVVLRPAQAGVAVMARVLVLPGQ